MKKEKFGKDYYIDGEYLLHESCEILSYEGKFHSMKAVKEAKNATLGKSHKVKIKMLGLKEEDLIIDDTPIVDEEEKPEDIIAE